MPSDVPDPLWGSLILQAALILLNAFFAATEIAVLTLNENRLKRQADSGDAKAMTMMSMVEAPAKFLSTIQIGITLAGFLGSAFAANNFGERLSATLVGWGVTFLSKNALENICIIVITLILSYFTLVFGELVPKRIAMQYSYKVARFASGTIRALSTVMKPIVWFLSASTNLVLRLCRVKINAENDEITEEGIRLMVDIGEEKGTIEATEAELIENIFEFNNQTAEDVMVHRTDITSIWADSPAEEILTVIRETGFSRFPVYDEDLDDIVGTLNTRDYLLNFQDKQPKPLRDLIRPAYFVPETVRADLLFRDMQKKKSHLAIVVDEYGGTSGLVTMEDLLEEIVGDIYDEHDPMQQTEITQLEKNLWRVSGACELETLSEALSLPLPLDEEFDTLGGLIFSQMTEIPEDGATPTVDAFGLHILVERMEDRRVDTALVSIQTAAEEEKS